MGISIPRSLAMSKNYVKILKSVLANKDANPLHKELRNRIIWEYNETVNKVFLFIKEAILLKALCQ